MSVGYYAEYMGVGGVRTVRVLWVRPVRRRGGAGLRRVGEEVRG